MFLLVILAIFARAFRTVSDETSARIALARSWVLAPSCQRGEGRRPCLAMVATMVTMASGVTDTSTAARGQAGAWTTAIGDCHRYCDWPCSEGARVLRFEGRTTVVNDRPFRTAASLYTHPLAARHCVGCPSFAQGVQPEGAVFSCDELLRRRRHPVPHQRRALLGSALDAVCRLRSDRKPCRSIARALCR